MLLYFKGHEISKPSCIASTLANASVTGGKGGGKSSEWPFKRSGLFESPVAVVTVIIVMDKTRLPDPKRPRRWYWAHECTIYREFASQPMLKQSPLQECVVWSRNLQNFISNSNWGLMHTGRDAQGEANHDPQLLVVTTVLFTLRVLSNAWRNKRKNGRGPISLRRVLLSVWMRPEKTHQCFSRRCDVILTLTGQFSDVLSPGCCAVFSCCCRF